MTDQVFIILLIIVFLGAAITIAYYWICAKRLNQSEENQDLQRRLDEANEKIQKQKLRIASLHEHSRYDPLTQLPDENGFREELTRRSSEVVRYSVSACVLLIEIEDFDKKESQFGSQVCDVILQHFAETIRSQVRVCDFGASLGRGQFAVVLSHTGIQSARPVADRLQKSVEDFEFQQEGAPAVDVTIAIGVAELGDDVSLSLALAEEALEQAKAKSSNQRRVVILDKEQPI